MNELGLVAPGVSLPESDIRSSSRLPHDNDPPMMNASHGLYTPAAYVSFSSNGQMRQEYDHQSYTNHASHATNSGFSHLSDQEIAAALASFQPCTVCTPATKTAIPHHHHVPGRLAGASATLDGHFCCSWLVHDQPCFLCFESAEALDNHIKSDHAGKDGTYRCMWQDCSKHDTSSQTAGPMNFGNKPKLMRHVHSHTGYKPFVCPYPGCDKGFVTKEQLKNHETTHTKSRKYQCQQCGKAFAVKSALTTHITAVHEEKKTHCCDVCGKAFADSSNLSKHKQTHYRSSAGSGVRKTRSRRGTSATTRSTPSSVPTPTAEPATPNYPYHQHIPDFHFPPLSPSMSLGLMGPPPPKQPPPTTSTFHGSSAYSTTSSPPPFDPSCYCCDQICPPPPGPASPCNHEDDSCDLDGFCDLPECAVPDECHLQTCTDTACDAPPCERGETCAAEELGTVGQMHWEGFDFWQPTERWEEMLGEA